MSHPALLLDENIQYGLAVALRENGWDAVHAKDIGMRRATDTEILEAAILSNRIVLTYNIRHFSKLDSERRTVGKEHPGILLSVERPIGELLRRLEAYDFSQIESTARHL